MQYNIDIMRDAINNNEIVKKLLNGPEFVGEYPRKVPTESGGYIPCVGKRPIIAFKPFPYQEPEIEISGESMVRQNCALSLADMDLMKGVVIK